MTALTDRKLALFAVVAAGLLALTIGAYSYSPGPETAFEKGMHLIQGLDPSHIQSITVRKGDEQVTLRRDAEGFVIPERYGYPADSKRINQLLVDVLDVRCAERLTAAVEHHAELGVLADSQAATTVTFTAENGQTLAGLVVGKAREEAGGRYVRRLDEDVVYRTEQSPSFAVEPSDYMQTDLVSAEREAVQRVTVRLPDTTYTIRRNEEGEILLQDPPAGKRGKKWQVESVFGAVPNLSFEDVAPAANAGVAWEATHTADTAHIAYTVQLGSKTAEDGEETFWARIGAEGPTTADLQKLQEEAREGGDVETLRQRHAALQDAQVQAEAFNRRHGDWVYRLGSWQAKRLRKPLGELLEEVPEGPEQIAARHILISYQGAERAGEEVTRSKEEARTLAASLREKLLAGEADFAELARKHSDGPSAEKGGDLGTFGRDQMHKNFEAAAFDLEVGGISKVVETPFGFHVIERTE